MTRLEQVVLMKDAFKKVKRKFESGELDALEAKLMGICCKKGNDYANQDRLSNFKIAGGMIGVKPEQNCLSLVATKVARLSVLLEGVSSPENEPILDSVDDLIIYSILLSLIIQDEKTN